MAEGGHCPFRNRDCGQRCDAGRHINLADPYVPAAKDAKPEPGGEQDGDSEQELIDRLPADRQTAAAGQILQLLMGATGEIADDARVDGARMLEQVDSATAAQPLTPPPGFSLNADVL